MKASPAHYIAGIALLLLTAGTASAQYGYSVQGPPPAGMGVAGSPYASNTGTYNPQASYTPAYQSMDPNMGMGTTGYGGPSYVGQQNYAPPAAVAQASSMLTYGQLEIDYVHTTYQDKAVAASNGVAVSLMAQLFQPLFLHFAANFSSGTTKSLSTKDYSFSSFKLGGGGYLPISNRFQLTGELGFLYANLDTTKSSISFSDGAVYLTPGVRFAATDSLELDGHLTFTSADKYNSFVFDLGGYYKLFSQMDVGLNVGFGDQSRTYNAGIRFRW